MTDQLPADIAEAIEAFGKAAYAQGYFGDSDHDGAGPQVKASRAALDAVILKHLGGGVSTSDVIAPLTFNGDDCFHPAGFEVGCQCIGCPRKAALAQHERSQTEG